MSFPRIESALFPVKINPLFPAAAYYRTPAAISTMRQQIDGFMP
jgi:hypothetical protein